MGGHWVGLRAGRRWGLNCSCMGSHWLPKVIPSGWWRRVEGKNEEILTLLGGRSIWADVGCLPGSHGTGVGVGRRARRFGGENWEG